MRKFIPKSLLFNSVRNYSVIDFMYSGFMFRGNGIVSESHFLQYCHNETSRPDSLTLSGLNDTTKIYNKATGVIHGLFPLNASEPSCTFIIIINGVTDTVEFQYDTYPHLISKECGYTYYHTLEIEPMLSYHAIDSIE